MVKISCTHICKWKNETVETILRRGQGIKGSDEGDVFNYHILWELL
jgi:hypothetical protein